MVKPDGVERGLSGKIISRFEDKGYHPTSFWLRTRSTSYPCLPPGLNLIAMKMHWADEAKLRDHYHHIQYKSFFPRHLEYMMSAPIVAMVFEGSNAISAGRALLGSTNPIEASPGTIRGDFCVDVGRNVAHGSDSVEAARREMSIWFDDEQDLINWTPQQVNQVTENPAPKQAESDCRLYDPIDGLCLVRDSGNEEADMRSVADQLERLIKRMDNQMDSKVDSSIDSAQ